MHLRRKLSWSGNVSSVGSDPAGVPTTSQDYSSQYPNDANSTNYGLSIDERYDELYTNKPNLMNEWGNKKPIKPQKKKPMEASKPNTPQTRQEEQYVARGGSLDKFRANEMRHKAAAQKLGQSFSHGLVQPRKAQMSVQTIKTPPASATPSSQVNPPTRQPKPGFKFVYDPASKQWNEAKSDPLTMQPVTAEKKTAVIRHEDGKWVLYSHKGKVLGTHPTKEKAVAQEQAIEISKHSAEKHAAASEDDMISFILKKLPQGRNFKWSDLIPRAADDLGIPEEQAASLVQKAKEFHRQQKYGKI